MVEFCTRRVQKSAIIFIKVPSCDKTPLRKVAKKNVVFVPKSRTQRHQRSSFIYLSNLLNEYHNGWKRHSLFEHSFAMAQLKFCEHFSISLNAPFKKYDTFYHKVSDIMITSSLYEALFINKKFCCFVYMIVTWSYIYKQNMRTMKILPD